MSSGLHTFIVSDLHLADVEPPHPKNPLWKKFKNAEFVLDGAFKKFMQFIQTQVPAGEPIELILNGDIFDFDSVTALPKRPDFKISRLEKLRGLNTEEKKSSFKLRTILDDHPEWVESLREFVQKGHRIVFVIGNHDIELHWSSAQDVLRSQILGVSEETARGMDEASSPVQFADWFYISHRDTLVEHGNQYDIYCMCAHPIYPFIQRRKKRWVRLPFGNTASRYMLNGMGLINPHSEASFIRGSFVDYLIFYYRYILRTQPLVVWTWFWGALVTLWKTLTEGFRPAYKNPLEVSARIEQIARRAQSDAATLWALRALHAHPVCFRPIRLLQELWLDRAFLFGLIFWAAFQFYSLFHLMIGVSVLWFVIPLALLMPAFVFYARSIHSEVELSHRSAFHAVPLSAQIAKVLRVAHGHTHLAMHTVNQGVEYLNTGTWSPSYRDVECTQPFGKKCFAWIRPKSQPTGGGSGGEREAFLYEWRDDEVRLVPYSEGEGVAHS